MAPKTVEMERLLALSYSHSNPSLSHWAWVRKGPTAVACERPNFPNGERAKSARPRITWQDTTVEPSGSTHKATRRPLQAAGVMGEGKKVFFASLQSKLIPHCF